MIIIYRSQFTCKYKYKYIDVLPKIDDGIRKENTKVLYSKISPQTFQNFINYNLI